MDDDRIWAFEESLWTGDADNYREKMDDCVLVVVPQPPFVLDGEAAIAAVSDTPRWESVDFSEQKVSRPEEGLIVIAYKAKAKRGEGNDYTAHCTTVMRRIEHEVWKVVQHQQTPPLTVGEASGGEAKG